MSKYIIKNCPCYRNYKEYKEAGLLPPDENPYCYNKLDYCQNITNCVMKKIVELCKKIIFLNGGTDFTDEDMYKHSVGENFVAKQVLQLLDIEECE